MSVLQSWRRCSSDPVRNAEIKGSDLCPRTLWAEVFFWSLWEALNKDWI